MLRIDEGVADPLRRDRVLVVSGVADERPARAVRPTEVIGDAGRPEPLRFASCAPQPVRDGGCRLEHFPDVPLDVSAYLLESARGPQHRDERQAVVRREAAHGLVVTDVLLEILGRESAEVAVVVRGERRFRVVLGRAHGLGHQRVHTVRTDHDSCPLLDGAARPAVAR